MLPLFDTLIRYVSATAPTLPEAGPLMPSFAQHYDVVVYLLVGCVGLISFLAWQIFRGTKQDYANLKILMQSFNDQMLACQTGLPARFADKVGTETALSRLIDRQDKLRDALPREYVSRNELSQAVTAIRDSVAELQTYMREVLEDKLRRGLDKH